MMQNKKIYALTGGIGSGKSTVLKIISELGIKTLSCDEFTFKAYKKRSVIKNLKNHFPTAVYGLFNRVDKKELSKLAFSSDENYRNLCKDITQTVFELTIKKAKKIKAEILFIEVPLLFEENKQDCFDGVFVVKRNLSDRIAFVEKRSNLKKEEIVKRINRQFDYEKGDLSQYNVIENNGDIDNLKENVIKALEKQNII